jgi:predicted aspartyl protease
VGTETFIADALPDTGYDGAVIIPAELSSEILAPMERRSLGIADKRGVKVQSWRGLVLIEDRTLKVRIHAFGDEYIIGRQVLDQMEICFEFGERVRLRFDRD